MIKNAFDAYRDYLAVVRHFTTDYNYQQFNGKVRVRVSTYEKRNDRYCFERIAAFHDPHWLIVANLVDDPHRWIGEVSRGTLAYASRKGRVEAMTYNLARELEIITPDHVNALCLTRVGQHPLVARSVMAGDISLETAAAISVATGCGPMWSRCQDPVLKQLGTRLTKYADFLVYDRAAASALITAHFSPSAVDISKGAEYK